MKPFIYTYQGKEFLGRYSYDFIICFHFYKIIANDMCFLMVTSGSRDAAGKIEWSQYDVKGVPVYPDDLVDAIGEGIAHLVVEWKRITSWKD